MKGMRIILVSVACVCFVSCARQREIPYQAYYPPDVFPAKVYTTDQVLLLTTNGALPGARTILVDVMTMDGCRNTGRLLYIDNDGLTLSTGFRNITRNGVASLDERKVTVSKEKILILKMW